MYLDCVEGWIRAVEILIYKVYAEARCEHCYEANQEDANDGSCGTSVDSFGISASGDATFFPAVDVEIQSRRDW